MEAAAETAAAEKAGTVADGEVIEVTAAAAA